MSIKETIHVLTEMNKWRRGEQPYDTDAPCPTPYSPEVFGKAIDSAVDYLTLEQKNQERYRLSI